MREKFELQLPDLLCFVKASCHESLHDTLSELRKMNENDSFPKKLTNFIKRFIQDLQRHLAEEENYLFPFIEKGRINSKSSSINELVNEHDKMKLDLLAIRQMTNNYQDNVEDNLEKSRYYNKLKEMDRILLNHIQIENHVLFPMLLKV